MIDHLVHSVLYLPPELFPPEWQPVIYFILLPLTILGLLFKDLIVWFLLYPPEARLYIMDKLFHKKSLLDYEDETGTRYLTMVDVYPEGLLFDVKKKLVFLLPTPINRNQIKAILEATKDMSKDKINEVFKALDEMEKKTLRAGIVKGLGVRIYRGYQTIGVATSLASLVGLEFDENALEIAEADQKKEDLESRFMAIPIFAKLKGRLEPTKLFIEQGKIAKEWTVNVLLPVRPSVVKKYINGVYDQGQLIALYRKGVEEGMARAKSPLGKWLLPIFIIAMLVLGVLIVAGIFLGGGGGA